MGHDRESPDPDADRPETDASVGPRTTGHVSQRCPTRRNAHRGWLAAALAILTVLSLVTTTVAVWARGTVYDTDRFMEIVRPALEDPAFYTALGDYVSNEALTALALEERAATALSELDSFLTEGLVGAIDPDPRILARLQRLERPTLASLAPSITSGLEARAVAIIDGFILSDAFRARLPELVEQAHRGGVAVIRNDVAELPNVYVEAGEVRLNLIPVIAEALQLVVEDLRELLPDVSLPPTVASLAPQGREQVATALQAELPDDFGQLTLISQDSLSGLQDVARQIDRATWAIAIVTLLLLTLTIAVSPHRRRTLVQLSLGVVVGLALAILLVRRLEAAIIAEITNPDGSQAARALFGELAGSLRGVMLLIVVAALLVGLITYLTGRPPWLARTRRRWSEPTSSQTGDSVAGEASRPRS